MGRLDRTEGEPQSLRGECSDQFTAVKQRKTCTEGLHCSVFPSLLHSYTGASGYWTLKLRICRSDKGRGLGVSRMEIPLRGLECGTPQPRKYRKKPGPTREARHYVLFCFVFGGGWLPGEGRDHHRSFFLQVHALRQQGTVQGSSSCKYELPLSSLTPEAVTGIDCCCSGGS